MNLSVGQGGEMPCLRPDDPLLPAAPSRQSETEAAGGCEPHLAHLTHPPSAVLHTLVQPSEPQPRGGKEPCEDKTGSCLAGLCVTCLWLQIKAGLVARVCPRLSLGGLD